MNQRARTFLVEIIEPEPEHVPLSVSESYRRMLQNLNTSIADEVVELHLTSFQEMMHHLRVLGARVGRPACLFTEGGVYTRMRVRVPRWVGKRHQPESWLAEHLQKILGRAVTIQIERAPRFCLGMS